MSGSEKFWCLIWVIISIGVITISVLTYVYWTDHNKKIVDLIKSGSDPFDAMCSLQNDMGSNNVCLIRSAAKQYSE